MQWNYSLLLNIIIKAGQFWLNCSLFLWQSKHDLKNKDELLVLVRKLPEGVPMGDLKDSYPGIAADVQVQRLITQLYCIEGRFEDDILLSCVS